MLKSNLGLLFTLLASLLLASCGSSPGGSGVATGGGTVIPPPPQPPEPTNYNTAEYRRNYGLSQMNTIAAYEAGATGEGITVAVIDSGIDIDHPQIQANIDPASTNISTGNKDDLNDVDGHGTAVAGVIANIRDPSNPDSRNTQGVAFDAKIMALNAASVGSCEGADGCTFADFHIAQALDYARERGVKIVNISLGGEDINSSTLVNAYKRAVDAGMIIILAAGNKEDGDTEVHLSQPEDSTAAAWESWANGQIIIAGAVDQTSTITDFSHRAGEEAKNFFLVAAGERVPTIGKDGGYFYYSGTSFAAPHIAGAAALLLQAFPNLSGKDLAGLMYETATDLGAVGVDVVYGRGLVNIEEAFKPQGAQSIAVQTASGAMVPVEMKSSSLFGGTAFGGFSGFSQAVNNSLMLDKYNRSYRVDLGQNIINPVETVRLDSVIDSRRGSRNSMLQFDQDVQVRLSWQEDWRFREVDENYFSNQGNARNRYSNLRMKMGVTLSKDKALTFAQGLSLKETLEDYDQDEFLTIGKEDFMALMGRKDSQAVAFGQKLSKNTSLTLATGHGVRQWQNYNLRADSYLMMARLDHKLSGSMSVGFDLGVMDEKGSVLGSLSSGAISLGQGATTGFVNARFDFGLTRKVKFYARGSYGRTSVKAAELSLVERVDNLTSGSFSIGLTASSLVQDGDRVSFAVSQPLRVMGGRAGIAYVSSRNYQTGSLSFVSNEASLTPDGREIDFELAYRLANLFGANVDINLLHQINPNHNKANPNNTGLLIRFGSKF